MEPSANNNNGGSNHTTGPATLNSIRLSVSDLAANGVGLQQANGSVQLAAQSATAAATAALATPPSSPPLGASRHTIEVGPSQSTWSNGASLLGTAACPRLGDVPIIEPLVVKKIAADPLSGVAFLTDCLLTGCQAGYLAVWNRPKPVPVTDQQQQQQQLVNGNGVSSSGGGGGKSAAVVMNGSNNNNNTFSNHNPPVKIAFENKVKMSC